MIIHALCIIGMTVRLVFSHTMDFTFAAIMIAACMVKEKIEEEFESE